LNESTALGWCPTCRGRRNSIIRFEKTTEFSNKHGIVANRIHHRVLECAGCETVFFQNIGFFRQIEHETPDEESAGSFGEPREQCYPPVQIRERPLWLERLRSKDELLCQWFQDVYFALDYSRNGLAAIAARTVIDRALIISGCSGELPFNKKVQKAINDGVIHPYERAVLESLFDAGSAATHRGWNPTYDEIISVVVLLEGLVYRTILAPHDATTLSASIPSRPQPDSDQ